MRSKLEHALAELEVVTKSDVEEIVENCLTKWTEHLQGQTVKAVESTFEDALQTNYFNSNIGLKICHANRRGTSPGRSSLIWTCR